VVATLNRRRPDELHRDVKSGWVLVHDRIDELCSNRLDERCELHLHRRRVQFLRYERDLDRVRRGDTRRYPRCPYVGFDHWNK
jgi:hypothetical protein